MLSIICCNKLFYHCKCLVCILIWEQFYGKNLYLKQWLQIHQHIIASGIWNNFLKFVMSNSGWMWVGLFWFAIHFLFIYSISFHILISLSFGTCIWVFDQISVTHHSSIFLSNWPFGICGNNYKNVISEHMLQIKFMSTWYEIALRWMPQDTFDGNSTLLQVMAGRSQATSHYPSRYWPRFVSPYSITRPRWVNIMKILFHWGVKNGRHCRNKIS